MRMRKPFVWANDTTLKIRLGRLGLRPNALNIFAGLAPNTVHRTRTSVQTTRTHVQVSRTNVQTLINFLDFLQNS